LLGRGNFGVGGQIRTLKRFIPSGAAIIVSSRFKLPL